jgi:TonB family protein
MKCAALLILALCCAGCASSTAYHLPKTPPPPSWTGQSGWRVEPESIRVNTGTQSVGSVLVEHDVSLTRTGTIKKTILVESRRGRRILIPEGSKAFAVNATMYRQGKSIQKYDPIEWCVVLPSGFRREQPGSATVCIAWETDTSSLYEVDDQHGGFAFLPTLQLSGGLRGPVPEIEEGPVDFGVRFNKQVRIAELTAEKVTIESTYSDGTNAKRAQLGSYKWDASNSGSPRQFLLKTPDYTVALSRAADSKTVEARRLDNPAPMANERTVLLELLIGLDGTVKDGRIAVPSGSPALDEKALEEAKRSWKLTPAMENGEPKEKWGRFTVTFKLVD